LGLLALALCGSFIASCSVLLDPTGEQCLVDGDCAARGGVFASSRCQDHVCTSRWACVGKVAVPVPLSRTVKVQMPVVDVQTRQPVTSGILARACSRLDPTCLAPLTVDQKPDPTGTFTFDLEVGQAVLIEIRPEDPARGTIVPGVVFLTPPDAEVTSYGGVQLISPAILSVLTLTTSQALPEEGTGLVVVLAEACFGATAEGISFALSAPGTSTRGFFFRGGAPSQDAVETDASGIAGFVNVPPGMQLLTAIRHGDDTTLGLLNLTVRAGTISYAAFPPTSLTSAR